MKNISTEVIKIINLDIGFILQVLNTILLIGLSWCIFYISIKISRIAVQVSKITKDLKNLDEIKARVRIK